MRRVNRSFFIIFYLFVVGFIEIQIHITGIKFLIFEHYDFLNMLLFSFLWSIFYIFLFTKAKLYKLIVVSLILSFLDIQISIFLAAGLDMITVLDYSWVSLSFDLFAFIFTILFQYLLSKFLYPSLWPRDLLVYRGGHEISGDHE